MGKNMSEVSVKTCDSSYWRSFVEGYVCILGKKMEWYDAESVHTTLVQVRCSAGLSALGHHIRRHTPLVDENLSTAFASADKPRLLPIIGFDFALVCTSTSLNFVHRVGPRSKIRLALLSFL